MRPIAIIGQLPQHRVVSSESRLMVIGAASLASSFILFRLTSAEVLAWTLMTVAIPLVMEAAAWQQAESLAGWRYHLDPGSLRGAYKVSKAVPRIAFLYVWLFSVLAARKLQALPDDGWIVAIILAPFAVWVALAHRSHSQAISSRLARRA